MKYLKNEKGSSLVYLLWIFTATIVLFLIITNIARIYIVKQQASASAELAALAATGEILSATKDAIKEFDRIKISKLLPGETYDPLWKDIINHVDSLKASGYSEQEAFIKTYNDLLPGRFGDSDMVDAFNVYVKTSYYSGPLRNNIWSTVKEIVKENEGNDEHLEIKISASKFRVEVKTDATYKTLTDGSLLSSFSKDIPQEGFGPKLIYLKEVFN